jgi:xenotropic and polytropic retrovirus receptor 1
MDWSLLQPHASKRFLRDVRGYKVTWPYYLAMILDPILRFNWIFYAIYTQDISHNSLVSFLVGFSEITRRGMWVIFRVENEHCANVARFKASRDVPLPYTIPTESEQDFQRAQGEPAPEGTPVATQPSPVLSRFRSRTSGALESQQEESTTSSMRRRPSVPTPVRTFTRILAEAHTQDFEKKRKPAADSDSANNRRRGSEDEGTGLMGGEASSDEDEEEEDVDQEEVHNVEALLRERRGGSQGEGQGRDS